MSSQDIGSSESPWRSSEQARCTYIHGDWGSIPSVGRVRHWNRKPTMTGMNLILYFFQCFRNLERFRSPQLSLSWLAKRLRDGA